MPSDGMDEYRGLEADGVPSAGETPAGGTAAAIGGGEGLRDATRKTPLWRGVSGCFREVGGGVWTSAGAEVLAQLPG